MAERRDKVIDSILRHHPQPLNIQPLNMVVPENVELNSEKASETTSKVVASEKIVSESPQQQTPEPHKPSSPQQQQTPKADSNPQPNIQTKQTSPQQPPTNTEAEPQPNPQPEQALPQPTPMDIDNHQVNFLASTSFIHIASDQPSSSTQATQLTIPESDIEILEQPPLDILQPKLPTLTRGLNLHRIKAPRLKQHANFSAPRRIKTCLRARITLHVFSNRS
jgi:hypothetical protein